MQNVSSAQCIMKESSIFYEVVLKPSRALLTRNDKPIEAQRFLMSQLERLALETCQLAGKADNSQLS